MSEILIVPGYGDSGPTHWQTLWEPRLRGARRVPLGCWENPEEQAWLGRLQAEVSGSRGQVILLAHSLGCLLAARYVQDLDEGRVAGLFLVAPPDPSMPGFPAAIVGFRKLSDKAFGVPSLVVSSTNDPYSAPGFAEHCALVWGARHKSIGAAGHINAASGHGEWPEGLKDFRRFLSGIEELRHG